MYYDGVVFKPDLDDFFLEHHGIKGQQWGVRNGPPYPLDSKISTGSRLKKFSNLKFRQNSKKEGRYGSALIAYLVATMGVSVLHWGIVALASIPLDKQEKVEYLKSKARYQKLKELSKNAQIDEKSGFKLKENKNATKEEDMEMVNALRGKRTATKGTYDNCARCSAAYDLRRRGYEVHATADKAKEGSSTKDIESWYINGKHKAFKDDPTKSPSQLMVKELSKQPVGSRGQLCVAWRLGGGHSMVYEIEKKGKVTVYNTQANEKMDGDDLIEYLNHASIVNSRTGMTSWYMRTDNLEPNFEVLKKKGIVKS